jgi:hypothetical protein
MAPHMRASVLIVCADARFLDEAEQTGLVLRHALETHLAGPGRGYLALWQVYVAAAAQRHMGAWGLERAREDHMRQTALRQIREAAARLGAPAASPE